MICIKLKGVVEKAPEKRKRSNSADEGAHCGVAGKMPKRKHAEEIHLEGSSKGRTGDGRLAVVSSTISLSSEKQKSKAIWAKDCNGVSIYVSPKNFSFLDYCQSWTGLFSRVAQSFAGSGNQSDVSIVSDAPTDSSDGHSANTDSDNDVAVLALKNVGNVNDLVSHLKVFIRELMGGAKGNGQRHMSFCMILWIDFLKDAQYNDPHVKYMEHRLKKLCTEKQIGEEEMAQEIHLCVGQEVVAHRHPQLLLQVKDKMETPRAKPCVASIAIIDHVVQNLLRHNPSSLKFWQEDVVKSWYSTPDESASDFFRRANDFLCDSIDGATFLLEGFEIQSYVTFMRMPRLAACLLFGYLETCKFESSSSIGGVGGPGGRDTWPHGFCTFVSSTGQVFSLTDADMPAKGALPTIVQGLQCLAHLTASDWETLGPVKTARHLVADENAQLQDISMDKKV